MLTILVICFSNSGNFAVVCEVWFRVQSSEFIRAYSLHTLDNCVKQQNKCTTKANRPGLALAWSPTKP